ncbi:MAG: hypothetical protein QOK21_4504 [Solirubrobacteraceae bacterium]|jgi:hypothetical protein|nr:hypothetical protein [Solirubrobacteraceae bacterium]
MVMLHRRHFTVGQANNLVPVINDLMIGLRFAHATLSSGLQESELSLLAETSGGAWPGRERAEAAVTVSLAFETLEELDVLVRDVERGIVDFPTLMNGREVYLCWRLGEREISHWHELESGFAGRRPLVREARRSS